MSKELKVGILAVVSFVLLYTGFRFLKGSELFSSENKTMRYISDSSYWLYLAHLPLVILAQWLVRDLPVPAIIKFAGIVIVTSGILLLTYEYCIRYTFIGSALNGPKKRTAS